MGRGGPARAGARSSRRPTSRRSVALSRSGRHAASDHLEIAAVAGVPTIGCRRAGGGLAGRPSSRPASRPARASPRHARPDRRPSTGAAPRSRRSTVDPRAILVVGPGTTSTRTSTSTGGSSPTSWCPSAATSTVRFGSSCAWRLTEPLTGRVAVFTAGGSTSPHLDGRDRPRLASPREPCPATTRSSRRWTPTRT